MLDSYNDITWIKLVKVDCKWWAFVSIVVDVELPEEQFVDWISIYWSRMIFQQKYLVKGGKMNFLSCSGWQCDAFWNKEKSEAW